MSPTTLCFSLLALAFSATAQTSVLTLGATGDGQTDDTAAIEKAVLSHGSLLFPKGTYRLTRTIHIPLSETGFAALSGDGTARIVMAVSYTHLTLPTNREV